LHKDDDDDDDVKVQTDFKGEIAKIVKTEQFNTTNPRNILYFWYIIANTLHKGENTNLLTYFLT